MVRLFTDNPTKIYTFHAVAKNLATALFVPGNSERIASRSGFKVGKRVIIGILMLVVVGSVSGQKTWDRGANTNNWSDGNNWNPNGVPGTGDDVIIPNNFDVTVNTTAVCASLTINGGGNSNTITISPTQSLSVTGAVTIGAGSGNNDHKIIAVGANTFTCASISVTATGDNKRNSGVTLSSGTITVTGNITMGDINDVFTFTGAGTLNVGGNMSGGTFTCSTGTVNCNGAAQIVGAYTYNNLTLSGTGVKNTTGITVNGVLSMEGTATASVLPTYGAAAKLQYNTSTPRISDIEWVTPFVASGGVTIANTGAITLNAAKVFNASIPLIINSGATLNTSATNNYALTFGGNLTNNGTLTANVSNVTIASTMATQSIGSFTTTGIVSMTKTAGTATFTGNISGAGLTINGTGGTLNLGTGLTHTFTGTWTQTAGTLNGGSSTLKLGSGVTNTGGTFTVGTSTVEYYITGAQTIAPLTYNNLTISGASNNSKTAGGNITVNGVLTLSSANYSATQGCLEMGSYTLNMGAIATTAGTGDVTGIVTRTFAFATTTPYSFGNQFTTLNFLAGGTLPTSVSVKIVLNTTHSWKTDAIHRYYDIIRTGGNNLTKVDIKLHYLDSELNGATENNLDVFDYHLVDFSIDDHVQSNFDLFNNWVGLSNINLTYLASGTGFDKKYWTLGTSTTGNDCTWTGDVGTPDWNDAGNWYGSIPGASSDVIIPDATTTSADPDLPASTTIGTITIQSGGILNATTGSPILTIAFGAGAWENMGTFNPGTGSIIFTNASATMAGTTNFNNVTVNNAASLTLGTNNIMRIAGTLSLSSTGILNASNDNNKVEYNGTSQTVVFPNGATTGYHDLTLRGSGTKTMPSSAMTIYGDFTMSGTASATAGAALTVVGNITLDVGTAFNASSFTHNMKGNWSNSGTFTAGSSTINLNGSIAQTLGGSSSTTFNNLIVNNSTGVALSNAINVGGIFTLTSGIFTTTSTNLLSITNTATTAISGGSATSFVNGPVKWTLPASLVSGSTYIFPVGNSAYLPCALVNPTTGTGTVTAQVQATNGNSCGTYDATLNSISPMEYWSLVTSGNFTNSSVSLTRQTTIIPLLDVVGGSVSLAGSYTTLDGVYNTYGVSNSNLIGTNRFFVLAKGKPTITTIGSPLTGFTYPEGYGPSGQQFFTVSGKSLTTNITVLPTDSFEISLTNGASFAPQSLITILVTNGTVPATTIYVRMKAGLAVGNIAPVNNISCLSDLAVTKTVTCSGTVTNLPVITITPGTLSGFYYNVGSGPTIGQSFTVSGVYLTSNIVITPPTNYEIGTLLAGPYQSTALTFAPSGGIVTSKTIYVRLKAGLSGGPYNENVVLTSTSAVTQNVVCNGSVNAALITLSSLNLGGFIYTTGAGPSGVQTFTVSGSNLTGNIVLTAPASFEICQTVGGTYVSSFSLTQSGGNVATTTVYIRMIAGLTVGPHGPGNLTAVSTGAIMQNISCSGLVAAASTATSISSNNTLNGFVYTLGNGPSVVQSFTVSGTALTSDITVTPPSNFEICLTSGGTYVSTALTIVRSGSIVNAVPVFVRLKAGLAIATYSGVNITLASSGATTQNVACNGVVITAPTITAGPSGLGSICNGAVVGLTSTAGPGVTNLYWSGPNGYYSTLPNPSLGVVSATNNGTYTVTGSALSGVNLLTNGDFESIPGNTGFGSSYTYVVPSATALQPEGVYTVTTAAFPLPSSVHAGFSACADHSSPGSYQMVINGATSAGIIAWSQSVSVVPEANYQFSYWVQTVVASNPAQLQLYVNGIPAGQIYTADAGTCTWKQYVYTANSESNTVLQLTLINKNTFAGGNDFALDDIMFQQAFPVTSSVDLLVNPTLPVSVSIAASISPLFSGGSVTFTATPVNGGTSPIYQWKINGSNAGTNSSSYTYTPVANDVITCVLTSNYSCPTGNPATSNTLTATARLNFWVGTTSTDWGTVSNWSGGFIPAPGNDVEYATATNNAGNAAIKDLVLDQDRTIGSLVNATNKRLIIPPGKGLIVNNTISTNNADSLIHIISSSTVPNGSLIFHNSAGSPVHATVEMYSKAFYDPVGAPNQKFHWQYFGIPLNTVNATPTFDGSYVRRWNEAGDSIINHWVNLNNTSVLLPFYGYEITQENARTIVFQGQLVNSDFNSGQLTVTSTALFPGQHIFSNPYTAAIDIRQLTFGSHTEGTVYLYNTGTLAEWNSQDSGGPGNIGPNAGQYIAVPKNTAGSSGLPRQIPSMQAILVKALNNSSLATFGISYNLAAMNNTDKQRVKATTEESVSDRVCTMIDVTGAHHSDRMWLFSQPGCSRKFDNGWDGAKMLGLSLNPQIFAIEPDGNYQVNAVDDINNTQIGFQAGQDLEYTLIFTHQNIKSKYAGMYLLDIVENKTIDITETGSTYSFVAESTPASTKRFLIATRNIEKDATDRDTQLKVFSSGNTIFVQNLGNLNGEMTLYDMMGHNLKKATFGPYGVTAVKAETITGAYVVYAVTSNERVSKRIFVGK